MFVVFDLDGTLADCRHRLRFIQTAPVDWDSFYHDAVYDTPVDPLRYVYWGLWRQKIKIEIWTGRPERIRVLTRNWLDRYGLPHSRLRMRENDDHRPDYELKEDWLLSLETWDRPTLVFEDRDRVVEMWRRNGVQCCQVAKGDY